MHDHTGEDRGDDLRGHAHRVVVAGVAAHGVGAAALEDHGVGAHVHAAQRDAHEQEDQIHHGRHQHKGGLQQEERQVVGALHVGDHDRDGNQHDARAGVAHDLLHGVGLGAQRVRRDVSHDDHRHGAVHASGKQRDQDGADKQRQASRVVCDCDERQMFPCLTRSFSTQSRFLAVARDISNHLTVIQRCSKAPFAVKYGVRPVVSSGFSTTRLREFHLGPI